jgi:hypothetical protein
MKITTANFDVNYESGDRSLMRDGASLVRAKWGVTLDAGFQVLPNVLLRNQYRLGLNATDVVVLAHLNMHWWYPERLPFPGPKIMAARMGATVRTVQRSLRRLQKLKFIKSVRQRPGIATAFDLSGLCEELGRYAIHDPAFHRRSAAHHPALQQLPINLGIRDVTLDDEIPFDR